MEVFGLPPVAFACRRKQLVAVHSIDLLSGYDLTQFDSLARALRLVDAYKPKFIIVSPPCALYSQLTTMWNLKKWDEATQKQKFAIADCLLDFTLQICKRQLSKGRWFAFEHPANAESCGRRTVVDL